MGPRSCQSDQRLTAREDEEAGNVRSRASLGRDQRRHHARIVWGRGLRYAAADDDSKQRRHVGIGTDATAANQYLPFTTLSFAVTGKMAGGARTVIRQTISREDALIAHTQECVFCVPGGQSRLDPAGQAGRSRRARSRLPRYFRPNQSHFARHDDGGWKGRLRRRGRLVDSISDD